MKTFVTLLAIGTILALATTEAQAGCRRGPRYYVSHVAIAPTPAATASAPGTQASATPAREQYSSAYNAPSQGQSAPVVIGPFAAAPSYRARTSDSGMLGRMERERRSLKGQW